MNMIFHSIKTIFLFKNICAEISPEEIGAAVSKIFRDKRGVTDGIDWECSIVNPLFGYMFKSNGFLENMQRFSPTIIAYYEGGKNGCNQDRNNDPLLLLLNSLFPLSSESLDNANTSSSTKESVIDNNGKICAIGEAFVKLLLGEFEDMERYIATLPRKFHAVFSKKAFEDDEKFPDYKNLKLLSFQAYALREIKTTDELALYLRTIFSELAGVNKERVQCLILSVEQRSAFKSLYAIPFNFPYSETKQPLFCDQIVNSCNELHKKSARGCYWTSADMTLLHLCSCLLYDESRGECMPDILKQAKSLPDIFEPQKITKEKSWTNIFFPKKKVSSYCSKTKEPLFSKVIKFFKKFHNRPFESLDRHSNITPTGWVGVLEKIEDYQPFKNQGEYSPHKVHYINEDYRYDCRYGIRLGIINIMRVLSEIFSVKERFKDIMESGDETSIDSISGKVIEFFRDVLSNDKITIENIEIHDLQEIEDLEMKDFTGELTISFRLKMSKKLVKMKLSIVGSINGGLRSMPSLNFISVEPYEQKNDLLAPFDSLDSKTLLRSILKRHVKLMKFENGKTDASGFVLDIAFNQGPLWSKKEKVDHLVFLCEYIEGCSINHSKFIKQVIGNLVRLESLEEIEFKPFFIYSEELLDKLDDQKKINVWLSFFKAGSESIPNSVKTAWTKFISKNAKSLNLFRRDRSLSDVALIFPAIKDFATEIELPKFAYISSQELLKMLKPFLEGNTVLTNLSIELNQFESKKEILRLIGNIKTLKALDISCSHLTSNETKILADFLATNNVLTELNIANVWYYNDADSARILFDGIQKNNVLKKLTISQSDKTITKHADDLKEAFDKKTLEVIYLP